MQRGDWLWKACDFCGKRVYYNEIDEDSLSLFVVDGEGEHLRAITEHDDDGEIVQVECRACVRARRREDDEVEFMDGFTVEELEDDTLWVARVRDEN